MKIGQKRRSYDTSFKREAVKLVIESGRVASEVAKAIIFNFQLRFFGLTQSKSTHGLVLLPKKEEKKSLHQIK